MNLISRKDESRIFTRHFLQSVGLVKSVSFKENARVMDLGSGAGFPGIPIKLIRPDLHLVLVESKKRKVIFLKYIVKQLGLSSIDVVRGRVEEVCFKLKRFDYILSRSVADLLTLVKWTRNCLKETEGMLVTVKGANVSEEIERLQRQSCTIGVREIEVKPYNPFPDYFNLTESYLVMVRYR